ncbi:hypothetical protein Purlil1_6772 [Purpureocillium lilacinum]|uniref:FAD-binding FR-type domain-containing protein n=1 Tax=Purpureocillium lilacinum TaxID=33203 RepID=A0ABR0BXU6_PURLI|nr:hypothetical protein Purlil1_6772 [Purpureocillium lilacinum]
MEKLHQPLTMILEHGCSNETLVLESALRLTPYTSVHTFSVSKDSISLRKLRPSQSITLQFPPDLDPIYGQTAFDEHDRQLTFTICNLQHGARPRASVSVLVRNGRITSLLGLPRRHGPLTAAVVGIGGGFPADVIDGDGRLTCVAGGIGIAAFPYMGSCSEWKRRASLLWSINHEELPVVRYLLRSNWLNHNEWLSIRIFVTGRDWLEGDRESLEGAGTPQGNQLETLNSQDNVHVEFLQRRMRREDLDQGVKQVADSVAILFCGSKSLEWQVRMWQLGGAPVYVTETL